MLYHEANRKPGTARPESAHVVIIGAGFGGLEAARSLKKAPVRVTVVDKNNHHVFQPLLYQVATASLSPTDISAPIRWILRKQKNASVLLGEVLEIDPQHKRLLLHDRWLGYDYLIVAAGMTHSYFGHDEWARIAPGLKTICEATEIRRRVLLAFETAEKCISASYRKSMTTFVVVGGGSTGVEIAGAIAELAKVSIASDFRTIETADSRVILVEAGPRLLPSMPEKLSERAKRSLEKLGVEVRLGSRVTDIQDNKLVVDGETIQTRTVVWAAGLSASPLGETLGAGLDEAGRVLVNQDLSVPGCDDVFVIGDLAHVEHGDEEQVPGLAPAAIQEGGHAATNIVRRIRGEATLPFKYRDKGTMATIGRASAVVNVGPFKFSGFPAWVTWLAVHIFSLIGFRNRLAVMFQWAWAYFTSQRHSRLITHPWHPWEPGLPDAQIMGLPTCHCQPDITSVSTRM